MKRTASIISAAAAAATAAFAPEQRRSGVGCCYSVQGTPHTGIELTGNIPVHCAEQMSQNRLKDWDRPNSSGHVRAHIKHTNEGKTLLPAARSFIQTSGLNLGTSPGPRKQSCNTARLSSPRPQKFVRIQWQLFPKRTPHRSGFSSILARPSWQTPNTQRFFSPCQCHVKNLKEIN